MKVAVINCSKTAQKCTAFGCFNASKQCSGQFEEYKDDPAEIWGYFHCGGCENHEKGENTFENQFNQLKKNEISKIHLSTCMAKCPNIENIQALLAANDFTCKVGTH